MLSHLPLIQLTHAHKQVTQAYMLGKTCIGYQTDSRRFALDYNNLMIENALNGGLARSLDELTQLITVDKASFNSTERTTLSNCI